MGLDMYSKCTNTVIRHGKMLTHRTCSFAFILCSSGNVNVVIAYYNLAALP